MRRRRNRATWFPILGFDNGGESQVGLSTVDVRDLTVNDDSAPNVIIVPIIPDIDVEPEQSQTSGGNVISSLRDFVEGQSCIIERVVGTIQASFHQTDADIITNIVPEGILCAALAVVPTVDDGTGNPAVNAFELDPLRADNSAQPWLWRRCWLLGDQRGGSGTGVAVSTGYPTNNNNGDIRSGPHIDTKGTKRVIRREERIFLIYSTLPVSPINERAAATITVCADLRVLGRMVRAKNRSAFK